MLATRHASARIAERGIATEDIAAALAGREFRLWQGNYLFYDPGSRCAVVTDDSQTHVVTVYRMTRRQLRHLARNAREDHNHRRDDAGQS
jgi:hypothetical protein